MWDELDSLKDQAIARRDETISQQAAEIGLLRAGGSKTNETTLGTRERDTLLKLAIGMAIKGYRYDPKADRSNVIPEIAADLEAAGVRVTDDTVRKYLREGAALLPATD